MWGGGRFMHFGEAIDDERFLALIDLAYEKGIRTFMTADVYGAGEADSLLGRALEGKPRDSYCAGRRGRARFLRRRTRGLERVSALHR